MDGWLYNWKLFIIQYYFVYSSGVKTRTREKHGMVWLDSVGLNDLVEMGWNGKYLPFLVEDWETIEAGLEFLIIPHIQS